MREEKRREEKEGEERVEVKGWDESGEKRKKRGEKGGEEMRE